MLKAFALAILILGHGTVSQERANKLANDFAVAAREAGEEPPTLIALGRHESKFNNKVCSRKGACGLMMLMPKWWGRWPDESEHIVKAALVFNTYRENCGGSTFRAILGYRSGKCYLNPKSLAFRRAAATYRLSQNVRKWLLDTSKPLRDVELPRR